MPVSTIAALMCQSESPGWPDWTSRARAARRAPAGVRAAVNGARGTRVAALRRATTAVVTATTPTTGSCRPRLAATIR
jgi:hypothetical protein